MIEIDPSIHLSFRFHVNLYHSYRGDSLDERGIGKDLRVIRRILDDLDALEAGGIVLRCAWDIENYYSLELYLPRHAPDIIERIRFRVERGLDEVELMSWNNGLLTAHTKPELREAISRAISNPAGSGLADLFPSWAPIARPQECMFTASHIATYRSLGVEAVSVYYSAIPFNGFGSFVPLLPPERRYNPMTLVDPRGGSRMRLLPACNHADIVERRASLRGWLASMRREQLAMRDPVDFLLVVDMDADDSFWEGWLPPAFSRLVPSACGLRSLARGVAGPDWLRFARPWDYLRSHPDRGELSLGQDLADGAWDGYSSWAEKAENAALWTRLDRARRIDEIAQRVEGEAAAADPGASPSPPARAAAERALSERLLALSTTHFGMASPVMNAGRLRDGFRRVEASLAAAEERLEIARSSRASAGLGPSWHLDPEIDGLPRGRGALATLRGPASPASAPGLVLQDAAGSLERRLVLDPSSSRIDALRDEVPTARGSARAGEGRIENGDLAMVALAQGGAALLIRGEPLLEKPLATPWIDYGGLIRRSRPVCPAEARELVPGRLAELRLRGEIPVPGAGPVRWEQVFTLAAGLPYLFADVAIEYPATRRRAFDRRKAARLGRDWDGRWRQVAPFEILPRLEVREDAPARVWKHGFDDRVSSYDLEYHRFGPDREWASLDNHVTDGWVAVAAGGRGLLVAQSSSASTVFAFCPMRARLAGGRQSVSLNAFGSYAGRQWRYPAAVTGLGRLAAILAADNLDPYAPSWEGTSIRFSLMLAPYEGDRPPEGAQRDALVFATPVEYA